MKEATVVKDILAYLKTVPGCFCWKEHGGMYGTAGIPDIIACIDGHFYGLEVKAEKGKPTKLQEATIRKILAAGGTALVVRSVGEVRTAITDGKHTTSSSAHECADVYEILEQKAKEADT